ncbi:serine protease easter-like [Daphnia pulicaria]|uniref:serine protease easter-like n=1 Tax=Daphnia pulicaria TaxID=35523 RepID=UPI001EEAD157|nr:serine protease easter-like [Daphnia pulicaria]
MLRVNRIVNHPSYNPSKSKVADDIALIQLDQEAEWNDLVQPSCLPNPDKDSYTGMTTVAGWGLTNEIQNENWCNLPGDREGMKTPYIFKKKNLYFSGSQV